MRSSTDDLVWIYDLPEHVISKIFTYFTTHNLVTTTLINTRWNTTAPNYWPELILPHRTPDKTKAKLITRSAASLKSIHFKFYFDYLLAFKSLSACSRLKHLTIGEGGLTWIAGATASSEQSSENKLNVSNGTQTCTQNNSNNNNNNNNSQSNHSQENGSSNQEPPMFEDTQARALVLTATNAANASAEAANRANIAINSASVNIFSAQTAYASAVALLRALPPSSNSSALQEALLAVGKAVEAADKAVESAAISAHGAASAANAASVASGMAGHVLRYHNTTYVVGSSSSSSSAPSSTSTEAAQQNSLRASHIKTLRITSGRSDKKVIPEYKHLQLFSNLRFLSLDGGISPPHLKNVILAARNLKSLKINCSDAGEELQSLQFAVSLASLSLQYFNQSFVPAVCKIPSLTSLRLQYTNHSPQIGMELIASSLPRIRSLFLRHPTFTIASTTTANDSELGFLRKLTELIELELRLPNCDPEVLGGLTLTTLRKLGASMVLPVSFVQQQPNLTHISLFLNQTTPANPKTLIPSPEKLTQITTLNLDGINISEPIIAILAQMNLVKLSIACEEISSSDLTSLFSSLSPTLAYLDLLVGFDVEPTAKLANSLPKPNPDLVISVAKRS